MRSELVRRARGGDSEAFETLIRSAYDRLFAVAERILKTAMQPRMPSRRRSSDAGATSGASATRIGSRRGSIASCQCQPRSRGVGVAS